MPTRAAAPSAWRYTRGIDLDVVDDGVGVADGVIAGLGLVSMRERATELGGTWAIENVEPSGTRVHAHLAMAP